MRQVEQLLGQARKANIQGKVDKARDLYEQFIKVFPDNLGANLDLGEIYMRLELFELAAQIYARVLENDSKRTIVLSNLGAALLRMGKLSDAREVLEYCLELDPKNIHARINLGGVFQGQEEYRKALVNALEAVSIDPTHPLAFNNLGSAFSDLAMHPEAKHAFETASMLDPNNIDALINLALAESKLDRPQGAIAAYERVLPLLGGYEKNRADSIKFFACFQYQTLGNLPAFWKGYECGFSPMIPKTGARSPNRLFNAPRWQGQRIPGKSLLVWREQGVGDEIMYASIISDLRSCGANVIFECEPRLETIWRRSFPWAHIRKQNWDPLSLKSPKEDFDYHIPLCSLGPIFRRSSETFASSKPYVLPKPSLAEDFRNRLNAISKGRPKVGVLWRSIKFTPARLKHYSSPLDWNGVLDRNDLSFISLQYSINQSEVDDIRKKYGDVLTIFEDVNLKDDFEKTVALVSQLDLVVSPDTTMFCIAGALGIPTILMWPGLRGYWGKTDNFIFFPSVKLLLPRKLGNENQQLLNELPERIAGMLNSPR